MPLDKRIEALRAISKGPKAKGKTLLYIVIEPNTAEVFGAFDNETDADALLDSLWDMHGELYCPDAYIEIVELNKDILGLTEKPDRAG